MFEFPLQHVLLTSLEQDALFLAIEQVEIQAQDFNVNVAVQPSPQGHFRIPFHQKAPPHPPITSNKHPATETPQIWLPNTIALDLNTSIITAAATSSTSKSSCGSPSVSSSSDIEYGLTDEKEEAEEEEGEEAEQQTQDPEL
ncbi:hypothetical protein F5876DRAFT_79986 [Lentinula aff. lateritia]|uniref:Uncharacterized protein n=1 Tax=Lentinula aff. lateritia TaxID=2804960 RepID=A0ACC1TR22_9AGAR|nr:hypothetical protein F5876DRAFT_79986 [Lentinula aff. lateritia]